MRNRNPAVGALRGIALSAAALLLAACASTTVVREEAAPRPVHTDARPARAAASPAPRGPSHVVQAGDTLYGIAFRNSLRGNAQLAAEYLSLKQRLASEYALDREAYTEGKSMFIQSVVKRAGAGAALRLASPMG